MTLTRRLAYSVLSACSLALAFPGTAEADATVSRGGTPRAASSLGDTVVSDDRWLAIAIVALR